MERCTRCILPVTLPGVSVDQEGMCNYCHDHIASPKVEEKGHTRYDRKRLEKILNRNKGKGRYDCLVPLSGGKDSTYVLYLTAKVYGMRVLAYNFDNGFRSKQAVENIERAVDITGADLVVYRLRQTTMNKVFKTFMISAGEFCSPCNLMMWDFAREIAVQKKIKLMLSGNSSHMAASIDVMSHSAYCDRNYFLNVTDGVVARREAENLSGALYHVRGIRQLFGAWPVLIDTFDYYDISVQEIEYTITSELEWKKPGPEVEHGDCRIACLKDYLMVRNYGCSEITGHYCSVIRNGQMKREEALSKAEAEEPRKAPTVLKEFLKRIDMDMNEFNNHSGKDFKDIKNIRSSRRFRFAKDSIEWWLKVQGKK